jgi:serine/threonine protein kinase
MSSLVFDKYDIQHRIAIGGMGEVFFAIQRGVSGFERPVILKSLLPDLAQQEDLVSQFLDEARVAATLNHPNVVSIFEVGLWNGTFYLAMEYIRGRNLAQLVRKAKTSQVDVPPSVAARIIREAALGLDHAHRATDASGRPLNIVHRDISPQNIMVREDGVTKVVDFGIASASNRSTRTATGTVKGKLAYMAPEQVLGQPVTPLVDQFALGVVFWELLLSRRLFKADNDLLLVKQVLEESIPRPETLSDHVPPQMSDVLMRMVEREPARRYSSLAEVAEALEAIQLTPTASHLPGAFMRRLGTDDLKLEVKPAAGDVGNFVIKLNQRSGPMPQEVDVDLAHTGEVSSPSGGQELKGHAKAPRRRALLAALGGVAVVLAAVVAVLWPARPAPAPEVTAPAPVVSPAPPVVAAPPAAPPAPAVPVPAEAVLSVTSAPAGVAIRLDGRPVSVTPLRLTLPPGAHHLLAEHPGYEPLEREVELEPGGELAIELVLKPRPARPSTGRPPVAVQPAQPSQAAAAEKAEPGFITIDTTPWAKVSIDGEHVGSTPVYRVRLSPGAHSVQFVNEGDGINVTRSITVEAGKTQRLHFSLQ